MEDRIRKFIEFKGISSSELADEIGVQRSNVTHVLKARNKPSFQFIEKLLQAYPEINAKWLLLGTGNMLDTSVKVSRTLFDSATEQVSVAQDTTQNEPTEEINQNEKPPLDRDTIAGQQNNISTKTIEKESVTQSEPSFKSPDELKSVEKPIERLIVFYKDQTFKVYYPSR